MPFSPGARLGAYEVIGLIGTGGMGEVYRAHDTKLNRDVALKVLPEAFTLDPDRLARFKREAQVLASLNHPNIGAIYGLEESDDFHALVLELVEGPTLADRMTQAPIPLDEALPIAKQIAEALEAAHEHGIIHRDLKPSNIKLRPDGPVKILDFGLAKAFGPVPSSSTALTNSPTLSMQATYAGVILGTAAYMSPEQASGKPVDKRADVWSFGVVLWEMLAGKPLFSGETISHTLADVLRAPIDLSAISKDTPRAIRQLLGRCLDRDDKRRLRDIGEARIAIEEATGGSAEVVAATTTPRAIPRPFWKRPIPVVARAVLVTAGVSAVVAWRLWPVAPVAPPITRFSLMLPEGQQFTRLPGRVVSIAPDGTRIVYVANNRLWLRAIGDLEVRPIAGAEDVALPVFSPDGLSIAFFSFADNTIKKIGVNGGAAITICPTIGPYGMSWTDDAILFGQAPGRDLLRVSPNGGKPEVIVAVQEGEEAFGPQALNGGQVVLFTLAKGADPDRWDKAQIVAQSLASGERRVVIDRASDAHYLPTGHLVYAVGGVLFARRFDPGRLVAVGGATPIIEGLRRGTPLTGVAHFSVSATGSLVYVPGPAQLTGGQSDLALVDRTGQVVPLKLPPGAYSVPRLSPDGTRVTFQADEGKEASIWIYDLSGATAPRRLTLGGGNRSPVWSADGRRVTFQSDREGDGGISWQLADGTGPVERLTKPEAGTSHTPDSWSPNGDTLLFEVTKDARHALWAFSLRDKKSERIGRFESSEMIDAVFSPDGRWMAYDSPEGGAGSNVFVEPFPPTGARYQVTRGGNAGNAFWWRDGQALKLVYGLTGLAVEAVAVSTQPSVEFGIPVPVPRGPLLGRRVGQRRNADQVPDGKQTIGVVDAGTQATATGAAGAPTIQVVLNWSEELKARVPTK